MHELVRTDDSIHRTDGSAMRAANAKVLNDERNRLFYIYLGGFGKRDYIAAEQVGQSPNRVFATRRAQVYWDRIVHNCRRIGPASRISALGALRLRQQCVDFRYEFIVVRW